jgi:hypothetical protein
MLLAGYVEVRACSCSYPPPVSEILRTSDAVVVAKLAGVSENDFRLPYDGSAQLKVEKVFKGSMRPAEGLTLWNGEGGNCIFYFRREDIGKSFLLYLSPSVAQYPAAFSSNAPVRGEPLRYATICDRSARVDHAAADLLFLDRLAELKDKTRVTATFLKGMYPGPNTSDFKLRIAGEKKTVELTAKNGLFETYELPPGRYTVSFPAEPGWEIPSWSVRANEEAWIGAPSVQKGRHEIPIELDTARHIELRIHLIPTAAINGRVLSPSGQPMKGVSVCLMDKTPGPGDWCRTQRTNEHGDFEFPAISAGKYYLTVNHQNRVSAEHPFNAVFFPGVSDPADAKSITVDTRVVSDLVIQIPEMTDLITVRGKTVFADERPARARVIRFVPNGEGYEGLSGRSSETGDFEITIPATATGNISAELQIGKDLSKDCPAHLRLFDQTSENWITRRSNEVAYPIADPSAVVLTFPITGCPPKDQPKQ